MEGPAELVHLTCERCGADLPPDAMFCPRCGFGVHGAAQGPVVEGFTILRPIGKGGAAVVYLARQESLQREVAIKVLRLEVDDPSVWRSFEREARTIAQLSGHPNVLMVYTAGHCLTGQPFLATEYMDRGSLADAIAHDGAMAPRAVARLGVAMADALMAAHGVGILHRDVKPGNMLLNHDGQVKLGDFGIARLLAAKSNTTTKTVAFTPEHVAPEVLRGEPEGTWSDVYGLGSALAEAATGRAPFARQPDERIEALLSRKLTAPPPQLGELLPAKMAALLTRALDPMPERRPTLEELRSELQRFANGPAKSPARAAAAPEPTARMVSAPREAVSPIRDGLRTRRRRRRILIPVALLLALLAGGTTAVVVAHDRSSGDDTAASQVGDSTLVTSPLPVTSESIAPADTAAPATAAPATTAAPIATDANPQTPLSPTKAAPTTAAPATTAAPTTAAPATTSPSATTPSSSGAITANEAEAFMVDYYDAVAARDYETSWAELAPEFVRGRNLSYSSYTSFWDKNDLTILDVRFVSASGDQAVVDIDLRWNNQTKQQTDRFILRRDDQGNLVIVRQTTL